MTHRGTHTGPDGQSAGRLPRAPVAPSPGVGSREAPRAPDLNVEWLWPYLYGQASSAEQDALMQAAGAECVLATPLNGAVPVPPWRADQVPALLVDILAGRCVTAGLPAPNL